MIDRLTGMIVERRPPSLVIDVQGVGYAVEAPLSTFEALPPLGEQATVLTHFVVREDAQLLYGFATATDRELFRTLLKVNGVGARIALAVLSGLSAEAFGTAVNHGDVPMLTRVPGIGKKLAERLVVELRDKLQGGLPSATATTADRLPTATAVASDAASEAVAALTALGYKPADAAKMVAAVDDDSLDTQGLLTAAFRVAGGKR